MIKLAKRKETAALKDALLSTLPWVCTSFGAESEIEAFVEGSGKWQTIADVHPFMNFDGEDIASFILHAVNNYEKSQALLQKAMGVLELCKKSGAIVPQTNQKIDEVLNALSQQDSFAVD